MSGCWAQERAASSISSSIFPDSCCDPVTIGAVSGEALQHGPGACSIAFLGPRLELAGPMALGEQERRGQAAEDPAWSLWSSQGLRATTGLEASLGQWP